MANLSYSVSTKSTDTVAPNIILEPLSSLSSIGGLSIRDQMNKVFIDVNDAWIKTNLDFSDGGKKTISIGSGGSIATNYYSVLLDKVLVTFWGTAFLPTGSKATYISFQDPTTGITFASMNGNFSFNGLPLETPIANGSTLSKINSGGINDPISFGLNLVGTVTNDNVVGTVSSQVNLAPQSNSTSTFNREVVLANAINFNLPLTTKNLLFGVTTGPVIWPIQSLYIETNQIAGATPSTWANKFTVIYPDIDTNINDYINSTKGDVITITTPTGNIVAQPVFNAGDGDDNVIGSTLSDTINLGNGNDKCYPGAGDDSVDGGTGIDTVIIQIPFSQMTVSILGNKATLTGEGTDKLTNIERIIFNNSIDGGGYGPAGQILGKNLAIDMTGNAGIVVKLLGAIFGASNATNPNYVGIGLKYLDSGMYVSNLAKLALDAAGLTTNDKIVNGLFSNIFGRTPSSSESSSLINLFTSGLTPAEFAIYASDSSANCTNINLTGLSQTGVVFTPS